MNFISERHAIYAGWVMGLAKRNGLQISLILDEGNNFTDRFAIHLPDGNTLTLVVPPPPEDWSAPE